MVLDRLDLGGTVSRRAREHLVRAQQHLDVSASLRRNRVRNGTELGGEARFHDGGWDDVDLAEEGRDVPRDR